MSSLLCGVDLERWTRIFGQAAGDRSALLTAALTPALLPGFPFAALLAVSIARLPGMRRKIPPLFSPFTTMGWTNYCVMLALVFSLHGYRQRCHKVHPAKLAENSSKSFWNHFFKAHLPAGHYPTRQVLTCRQGQTTGRLPRQDIIIKPDSSGAGHHLQAFRWNETSGRYECSDRELKNPQGLKLKPDELMQHIRSAGVDMIVEHLEQPRTPLPVCTLRVLTLYIDDQPELICAAFLPAPAGSASTAYFDLDTYLVDMQTNRITEPLSPRSNGRLTGTRLPELGDIVRTCLHMHSQLREHLQISWDIVPTAKGPVYLEGNVFPPGCDYKLSIFKNTTNFRYLLNRILGERGAIYSKAARA